MTSTQKTTAAVGQQTVRSYFRNLAKLADPEAYQERLQVDLLSALLPTSTLLRGTDEYEAARQGFWAANQAQCTPFCIFQPSHSLEIAEAMQILRKTGCPFGIKSGGHGRCAGESSISAGVLIDLKALDRVDLAKDRQTCWIGPGSTWAKVYSKLNPQGLTVVGGRASTVGVGGFCLSGGLYLYLGRVSREIIV